MVNTQQLYQHKRNAAGFTIIETVVVIALFLIILSGLLALYTNYNKVYNSQQATARVIGAASTAASELQSDVRQASEIMTSYVFSGTTYTTDSNTLVLKLPAVNSSGSIISSQYDYVAYDVSGAQLLKRVLGSSGSIRQTSTRQLSDTVSTASFTYTTSSITVDILMQVTVGRTTMSQRLQQTLYLRNI